MAIQVGQLVVLPGEVTVVRQAGGEGTEPSHAQVKLRSGVSVLVEVSDIDLVPGPSVAAVTETPAEASVAESKRNPVFAEGKAKG